MEKEFIKSARRAYNSDEHTKGIHTHTFVFDVKDMMANGSNSNGEGNDILEDFCCEHTVLSAVFNVVSNKLVYFIVYR